MQLPYGKPLLLLLLAVTGVAFVAWWRAELGRTRQTSADGPPTAYLLGVGVLTDFLDTLGIGSFATTTTAYRLASAVDDRLVPGTLNAGHALPTIVQAFIYVTIVQIETTTLVVMIGAAVLGGYFGSGVVSGWPRRAVRLAMGTALLFAAGLMSSTALGATPEGGGAVGLEGPLLFAGAAGNFVLGALMTAGIGLYAPCMILVSLLGMNPTAAFPIMMGSCAFLMPAASVRFIRRQAYDPRAALALTLGGIPAVLLAAFIVRSLPLSVVRWLVVGVVVYTAFTLLRAARRSEEPSP